jgi:hypothetical protein
MTEHESTTTMREDVAAEHERLAAEAFKPIRSGQHFRDWVFVGYGLVAGRVRAMRETHTNEPKDPQYNKAFGRWMDSQPDKWPRKLHKSDIAHCFWLIDTLPSVEAWRDTLAANKKDQLNHPSAVKRAYDRATRVKQLKEAGQDKPASPYAQLQASVVELEADRDLWKRRAEEVDLCSTCDATPPLRSRVLWSRASGRPRHRTFGKAIMAELKRQQQHAG